MSCQKIHEIKIAQFFLTYQEQFVVGICRLTANIGRRYLSGGERYQNGINYIEAIRSGISLGLTAPKNL